MPCIWKSGRAIAPSAPPSVPPLSWPGLSLIHGSSCFSNIPYFTAEAPTCFDSYNQPRLGGGRLFEHAAIEPWKSPPKSISTLLPCSCINN